MKINNFLKFIIAVALSELAGIIGSMFTVSSVSTWYAELSKPAFNPPDWIFGPVWTILYLLIGISLYIVWGNGWKISNYIFKKKNRGWNYLSNRLWSGNLQKFNIIAIFIVQYVLNIAWSFVFFGLHRIDISFFIIVALWIAIFFTIINFYRISKLAAWLLFPYILWVAFAGYLNYSIWQLSTLSGGQGITGTVLLGPTCPVERIPPDPNCADKPYAASLEITTADGTRTIKKFISDLNGKFRVDLPIGEYKIQSAASVNIYPRCSSGVIKVIAGQYTTATVYCDTGIR